MLNVVVTLRSDVELVVVVFLEVTSGVLVDRLDVRGMDVVEFVQLSVVAEEDKEAVSDSLVFVGPVDVDSPVEFAQLDVLIGVRVEEEDAVPLSLVSVSLIDVDEPLEVGSGVPVDRGPVEFVQENVLDDAVAYEDEEVVSVGLTGVDETVEFAQDDVPEELVRVV